MFVLLSDSLHLIVTFNILNYEYKVVVQIKSFVGSHSCLQAISQIEGAINTYSAVAGIIVTTASSTEELETAVNELSEKLEKHIELIAGDDVARFVLKYAPEMVFKI